MDDNADISAPKMFVSYSWTDQAHIDWVIQLATDLRSFGIDTVVDRWHLREGQDAHSFMEKMVRSGEVAKSILVCDRKYVERANKREGGVGAESQIVTSTIYNDVEQTKFVAVVRESAEDGSPALPNFLTSRIFIDFREDGQYAERIKQLIRWAFDRPLYLEPEIGPRPKFLDDQINFEPIRVSQAASTRHNSIAVPRLSSFFDEAARQKADFTVEMIEDEPNDETVYRSIISLSPVISQIILVLSEFLNERELEDVEIDCITNYLSEIYNNYEKGPTNWSADVTKFFGQFILTAIVSNLVKFRRFESAACLLNSKLLKLNYGGVTAEAKPLAKLNCYLRSLDHRNARLEARRASLHSDIIKQVCELSKIDLVDYMQADLILYLSQTAERHAASWWPDSLLYAADAHGAFPWFAKAVEASFGRGLMQLVGVTGKSSAENLIAKIDSKEIPVVRWDSSFSTVDIKTLANLNAILETYP